MSSRIAGACALIVFAVCLAMGLQAGNPFTSILIKALTAMLVTLMVGWVLGAMAQKMLTENIAAERAKKIPSISAVPEANSAVADR